MRSLHHLGRHGRRGALKLATSTKDFKTESESSPTYIQGEILKKIVIFLLFASLMNENLSFRGFFHDISNKLS